MVDGGKMAKSLGNFYTLDDLQHRGYTPAEVRYTLLSGHYHQPLNFTLHSLDAARAALQKLAKFDKALRDSTSRSAAPGHDDMVKAGSPGVFQSAWDCLLDNLNVPAALGGIFTVMNHTKRSELSSGEVQSLWSGLHFMLDALGIILPPVKEDEVVEAPDSVKALAEQRWLAKQARDFASADDLRKQVELAGWIIKDSKDGYTLVPKS
jgi:cysteinyl-tRNA synthetase